MAFKPASGSSDWLIDCVRVFFGFFFFRSTVGGSHHASSELNKSQFLVVMAAARTSQRNYPGLRDPIL